MIKHCVCFKFENKTFETIKTAKEKLLSMQGKVPTALKVEVHEDFLGSARSYDLLLEVTLENRDKLDNYQNDDYHCNVVKKYMHSVVKSSVAIDYEI